VTQGPTGPLNGLPLIDRLYVRETALCATALRFDAGDRHLQTLMAGRGCRSSLASYGERLLRQW